MGLQCACKWREEGSSKIIIAPWFTGGGCDVEGERRARALQLVLRW